MSITVNDLLHSDVFRQCSPIVAGGSASLNQPVRWVYTHERYDVTQFLSGGEFLLIEGSVLASHACERGLRKYMESLAAADVRGLAVELVDYFTEIPKTLAQCGDELGIPVIGLRTRQPFVLLCQEGNTQIMKEQLQAHMRMDNLSTELNAQFAHANSLDDIAAALHTTLGESALIISSQGEVMAAAGTATARPHEGVEKEYSQKPCDVLTVRKDGFLMANIIISNTIANIDVHTKQRISATLRDVIAPFTPLDARLKIIAQLFRNRPDATSIADSTFADLQTMLHALGYLIDVHCVPFLVSIRAWDNGAALLRSVIDMLSDSLPRDKVSLIYEVEGDCMVGSFMCNDPTWFASLQDFADDRFRSLHRTEALAVFTSDSVVGVRGLLEALRGLRFTAQTNKNSWGKITSSKSFALCRLLSFVNTAHATDAFIYEHAAAILDADATTLDTLCALFDCMGNKTSTCERLGIQRQTLYNRLDKIVQMTGIPQHDTDSWSLLTLGAKFIAQKRRQGE